MAMLKAFAAAWGTCRPAPSASLNMSCSRPVAPRSIPDRSISSESSIDGPCACSSSRSVTLPTFIGRPASSNPFSCSSAFLASSQLWNCNSWKSETYCVFCIHYTRCAKDNSNIFKHGYSMRYARTEEAAKLMLRRLNVSHAIHICFRSCI